MEKLFILKDNEEYFRFSGESYTRCSLQKASVYPMDEEQKVRLLLQKLHEDGVDQAQIFVLTLSEELYEEEGSKS